MKSQIGWQLGAYDSLDTKTGLLLAFDGVIATLILSAHGEGGWPHLTAVGAIVISALMAKAALWPRAPYIGPVASNVFNRHLRSAGMEEELLAKLSAAVVANNDMVAVKSRLWKWASVFLLVGVVCVGLAAARV
ncbi:MAG: hypothetical protein M0Z66_05940 [Thermaerobacter sp.]|nr:hypothetical protein [Thermaerobacter sp.]